MSRLPGLDLLRAFAIVWVMFYHGIVLGLGSPWPAGASFGWMGVDLFFVLSGFLIGSQWLAECQPGQPAPFGRFYLRRAFRILPAYLAVVAVYFVLPGLRERPAIMPLWQFLSFTENLFIDAFGGKSFSHVWSLCVEEHFYLLFPIIAWLLLRRPSASRAVAVLAAIALAGLGWRTYLWLHEISVMPDVNGEGSPIIAFMERIYYPTWTRLDGLLAGIALALVQTYRPALWQRLMARGNALLAGGVLLLAGSMYLFVDVPTTASVTVGYPLLALAWMLVVAGAASTSSLLGSRRIPGAATLAALAYSLYLSHKLALHGLRLAFGPWLSQHGLVALFAYACTALAIGALLYFCVERPFLRLRERLLDNRQPSRLAAATV